MAEPYVSPSPVERRRSPSEAVLGVGAAATLSERRCARRQGRAHASPRPVKRVGAVWASGCGIGRSIHGRRPLVRHRGRVAGLAAQPVSPATWRAGRGACPAFDARHTRWRLAWHSGRMRWIRVLIGVALVVVGAVWALQGYGKLEGSFMTGSPVWMWIGILSVVLGVVLLLTSRPRMGGRARRG
jgi:hypothetical protein